MFAKVQSVAKFLVALIGTLITAGTTFIPEEYGPWLGFAAAILTAVATYVVPNTPAGSEPEHRAE
jgi:hypothetical protein